MVILWGIYLSESSVKLYNNNIFDENYKKHYKQWFSFQKQLLCKKHDFSQKNAIFPHLHEKSGKKRKSCFSRNRVFVMP